MDAGRDALVNLDDYITIHQSVFDDWYTNRE